MSPYSDISTQNVPALIWIIVDNAHQENAMLTFYVNYERERARERERERERVCVYTVCWRKLESYLTSI